MEAHTEEFKAIQEELKKVKTELRATKIMNAELETQTARHQASVYSTPMKDKKSHEPKSAYEKDTQGLKFEGDPRKEWASFLL